MKTYVELISEEAYKRAGSKGLIENLKHIPAGRVRIINDTDDGINQTQTGKDEHDVLWVRSRQLNKKPNNGWHPPITLYGLRLQLAQEGGENPFSDWELRDI